MSNADSSHVDCFCEGKVRSVSLAGGSGEYSFLECASCGFAQTVVNWSEDRRVLYESGHYQVSQRFLAPFLLTMPDNYSVAQGLLKHGILRSDAVVDFGCGKGYLLKVLRMVGYTNLFGVETSVPRAEFAGRFSGACVSTSSYVGGKIVDDKVRAVTLIHVLEHVPDPFRFLQTLLRSAVSEGGVIIIEVPNYGSDSFRRAGGNWAHLAPRYHLNHFTVNSFRAFCSKEGVTIEDIGTFSLYNSTLGMLSALLSMIGYRGQLFEDAKAGKLWLTALSVLLAPLAMFVDFVSAIRERGSVIRIVLRP